jgi:hypothetical protein
MKPVILVYSKNRCVGCGIEAVATGRTPPDMLNEMEIIRMDRHQPDTGQFIRDWLTASVLVWPLALGAWVVACMPIGFLFNIVQPAGAVAEQFAWIAMLTLTGALVGYIIGDAQRSIMRDTLAWWSPDWARASVMGGLLGGAAVYGGQALLSNAGADDVLLQLVAMPLFALGLSVGQWPVLRQMAHQAWLWVIGNTSAAIVFGGLLLFNQSPLPGHVGLFIWFMIAAICQGAVTGYVILWLYERLRRVPDDEREPAPVYLEVRNQPHDRRR